jgi:hypothetical protein
MNISMFGLETKRTLQRLSAFKAPNRTCTPARATVSTWRGLTIAKTGQKPL